MDERRKNPRLEVSFPVECDAILKKKYFYTVCKDLSVDGIKILSNEFIAKNQDIKLNINLVDKVLGVKGKVMWCSREPVIERYAAGIRFEEISDDNKKYLSSLVR
jgi:hypothetical protein